MLNASAHLLQLRGWALPQNAHSDGWGMGYRRFASTATRAPRFPLAIDIEQMADLVERAFEDHYERTAR